MPFSESIMPVHYHLNSQFPESRVGGGCNGPQVGVDKGADLQADLRVETVADDLQHSEAGLAVHQHHEAGNALVLGATGVLKDWQQHALDLWQY